jgi:hypothetical protein
LTSIFATTVQTTVTPSYYSYKTSSTDFIQTQRKIPKTQIKCYPLDILKDVETDGSVTINTKDKTPVNTTAAQAAAQGGTIAVAVGPAELQAQSNTLVLIFSIVFIILGIFLMIAVYNTIFPRESGAAAAAVVAAALPGLLPSPPVLTSLINRVITPPVPIDNKTFFIVIEFKMYT